MNVLLLSASPATQRWLRDGCGTAEGPAEINRCSSLDFGLRVLEVDDEVHMIAVDADLMQQATVDAIKQLWRACRSASVLAIASSPTMDEMVACVNAGALGYVPRAVCSADLARVLTHVADGGLWLPDLRQGLR